MNAPVQHASQNATQAGRLPLRQRGAFAIEFSIVALLFLSMVFTIIEVSRALYIMNTLQEVTRRAARAAATTDFSDANAMDRIRQEAIFRTSGGELAFAAPITDKNIVIDYLSLENDSGGGMTQKPIPSGSMPACPAKNRLICTADSGDASCIRFVRVKICQAGSNCDPVPYSTMISLVNLAITHPISTTVMKAESLGYQPGMPLCN